MPFTLKWIRVITDGHVSIGYVFAALFVPFMHLKLGGDHTIG
jgi:hypothetical protein